MNDKSESKIEPKRILVSVADKAGLEKLLALAEADWQFVATPGSSRALRKLGVTPIEISAFTGVTQNFCSKMQTRSSKVHLAISTDWSREKLAKQASEFGIMRIHAVVVNLPSISSTSPVHDIDVGGPCLLTAAIANYRNVMVMSNKGFYDICVQSLLNDTLTDQARTSKNSADFVAQMLVRYYSSIQKLISP